MTATTFGLSRRSKTGWWKLLIGLAVLSLWIGNIGLSHADGAEDDLTRINAHVQNALKAVQAGDLTLAQQEYKAFKDQWLDIEDGVRTDSKDSYKNIEDKMSYVADALFDNPIDPKTLTTALTNLETTNEQFIKGNFTATTVSSTPSTANVGTLLTMLDTARTKQAQGDWSGAAAEIKQFEDTWLDVEGQIKTRDQDAYVQTENDMGIAYDLLNSQSAQSTDVLNRMYNRLKPYENANSYGIFDAMIILLREGLEALLVVVALLAYLKKSGNNDKQVWVWGGVGAGLALSILLALAIQLVFASAVNSSNREMLEGITGLVATVMLIYVSYWMHNKANMGAWQQYIKQKSSTALAKGSLLGIATLSFLAIFREGAETALFYLGIATSISTSDLLIGLAIGSVLLVIIGFLLIVIGVRIPMRPFFRVASVLVFYLCFKFLGTGVHSLQVGQILPNHSAPFLPSSDFFGMYSSWETTIAQVLLLLVALGGIIYSRIKDQARLRAANASPLSPAQS